MWAFLVGLMATLVTGNMPVISSIPIYFTRVHNAYNYVVTATAIPAPAFSMMGAPSGVAISSGGVVSGIPTVEGVFDINITAANTDGSFTQSFSLTVGSVPTLVGTPILTAPINTFYFVSFGTTGFPVPTLAFSGPSWLQQSGSNFSGYSLSQEVSQIMVVATNQFGTATESWSLSIVGQAPVVMGTPPSSTTVGTHYTYTFAAVGTTPLTWSISGGPSWLSVDSNGVVSGDADTTGSYPSIIVTVTNSGGSNSTSFPLSVTGVAPSLGGTPLAVGIINTSYSFPLTIAGQPFPVVSISGGPAWLTVSNGVVSGVPNVPGHYDVVVIANSSVGSAQLMYTLDVSGVEPFLAGGALPTATQGQPYNYSFPRNGLPLGTCSFSGVPAWLSVDAATCTISGTPSTSASTINFTVTQSNNQGSDTETYSLYVRGITMCSLPMAVVNNTYSYTCNSTSQPPPTFTLSGAPAGITMTPTGAISGTPVVPGVYPMTVMITNGEETLVESSNFVVLGNAAPVFISTPPSIASANQMFMYQMAAQGRPGVVYSVVSGPSWLSIVDGDFLEGMPRDSDEGSIVVVLRASNGVSPDGLQQFVLTVQPPLNPIIKSVCPAVASVGTTYTCNLEATGATPISFLIGSAPDWLMMEGCCTLKGTPDMSDVGASSILLTASNSYLPNDIQSFNIMVSVPPTTQPTSAPTIRPTMAPTTTSAPVITSLPPTSVTIGGVYFYPVTVTGQPAPVLTVSDLPSWLRLVGNILTGTPPTGTAGTTTISLTATNGAGPSAVQSFVLTISNPPTSPEFISSPISLNAAVGSAYSYPAIVAVGTPTPTYTYSAGPAFLSLSTNNGVTSLTGTPPVGSEGTYSVILVAANGVVPPDSQVFTLNVAPMVTPQPTSAPTAAPVVAQITSTPPVSATSMNPFIYVVTATGSPAPTFNVTGLPSWLSFTGGNTISGSPPVGMTGSSTFKVVALQGGVPTATQYVTVLINSNGNAPTFTSTPPLTGQLGSVYTYVARATGSPDPVFLWTMPSWLTSTITPTGDIISGVPTVPGDYSITVLASNGVSPAAVQTFNVSIISVPTPPPTMAPTSPTSINTGSGSTAPLIISSPPNTAVAGSTFLYHVVALGTPTPYITTTQLPSWLHLSGCCDITGTVPAGTGSVLFTVTATNGVAPSASQTVSLMLQSEPAPKITSVPVTSVKAASLYQYTINVQGNPVPLLTSSTLPSWLRLMGNILIGTPPRGTQGVIPVTLTASNGVSPNDQQQFSIIVEEQLSSPSFTSLPPLSVTNGSLFSYTFATSGNPSPSVSSVILPSWLTLSGNTVSGYAPQQGGRFDVVLQASNGNLPNAQQSFAIQVLSKPYLNFSDAPTTASVGYVYMYTVASTSPTSNYTMVSNATWLGLNGQRITGSPPPGVNGTFCYTINATNSMGSGSDSACFKIVTAASCATTLTALNAELQSLLSTTRAKCQPDAAPIGYPNTTCHYQCDHPVVLVNDLTLGVAAGRRLLARMLLSLTTSEQTAISTSAANQWGLAGSNVHTMSDSNVPDVRLVALSTSPLAPLASVNNAPVVSTTQGAASQTDLLALIKDLQPGFNPGAQTVTVTVVRDEPAWYTYLIIMLLVATAICWIIFIAFAFRKKKEEEPEKIPMEAQRDLEDNEIRAARLELEAYHRDLENLQAMHEQARAEALRKDQVGQFEQAEVSRLLKQMVELEATQQQQHAQQVAALNAEIASLRAKAAGADARQGDRLAQAQQHEELKRLNEEYRKLKSDRALLQADDLRNQKKLLDTVENLTRALEKSRADSEEMKAAIEDERRRRIAAENARAEREKQDQVAREQERLLEERARLLRDQAERDRLKERDRAEQDRLQKEKDRLEAERQRLAASREQMERDREQEKLDALGREREALEMERRRLEAERLRTQEKERLEKDKAALEAERARLAQERQKKEEERKKKELDAERTRLEQEKEKLTRDRELLQRQQEERARAKSPGLDPNGFSEDSGFEDDSGGSDPEPQPMRFPKGPGLQDSDDDDASKFKTLSRAQQGVLQQWKQREKEASDLKAREKRRAARRLARRKARHEARREARAAERAKAAAAQQEA